VDLSAVIFVVLALAWAVYLIPKALQHHDEMASDRLVEGHSERVRILRRRSTPTETVEVETEAVTTEVGEVSEQRPRIARTDRERAPRPELTPAGAAARRRRRVLGALVLLGVVLAGLAKLSYVPLWSVAFPVVMVAVFLAVARRSVRSAQRSSLAQRRPVREPVQQRIAMSPVAWPAQRELREEQVDLELDDPALETQPESEVLADDGSLWDPLPMTLPTYVNKARARRTVRTIELTGMHSSGHDEDDSALAREAAAASSEPPAEEGPSRRVAGA
jgi:hypothetical protein